jgi:hypothetical protein
MSVWAGASTAHLPSCQPSTTRRSTRGRRRPTDLADRMHLHRSQAPGIRSCSSRRQCRTGCNRSVWRWDRRGLPRADLGATGLPSHWPGGTLRAVRLRPRSQDLQVAVGNACRSVGHKTHPSTMTFIAHHLSQSVQMRLPHADPLVRRRSGLQEDKRKLLRIQWPGAKMRQ